MADGSADRLEANMVISIEPGIYLRDVGGFRHSDMVALAFPSIIECVEGKDLAEVIKHKGPLSVATATN